MNHASMLLLGSLVVGACAPGVDSEPAGPADASSLSAGGAGQAGGTSGGGPTSGAGGGGGDGGPCVPADDHSSDPQNCGACGHHCLGGACAQGVCQRVAIWAGVATAPLFVDNTYVYWVRSRGMGEHHCADLTIVRAPKSSGTLTGAPEVVEQEGAGYVSVREGSIYYGTQRGHISDNAIREFAANSSATPATTTLGTWPNGGLGLAAGATAVYALTSTSWGSFRTDLVSVPVSGGPPTTLVSALDETLGVLTDDVNVYWPLLDTASIMSVPVTGGVPTIVVSSQALGFHSVTLDLVDGEAVYYVEPITAATEAFVE